MATRPPPWTLGEIAEWVGGRLEGPSALSIHRLVPAGSKDPAGLTFAESADYAAKIEASGVGAVLLSDDLECNIPCIRMGRPREAFFGLLQRCVRPLPLEEGIHVSASVHPEAFVEKSARVGAHVVIERGASVGADARIHPQCYIGENCAIGAFCELYPGVVLYRDVAIGERTVLHSGSVIGADGFGYFWDGQTQVKIPQVGSVSIGKGSEIGANTTIDRATMELTSIGDGTKIDNLVQVAHNVSIGDATVIAGLSGIAGSSTLGDRVTLGGGVGIRDHVNIGDDVMIGGRSGVGGDLIEPGEYFGTPALPKREAIKSFLLIPKLPELYARIKELEKKLEALESGNEEPN